MAILEKLDTAGPSAGQIEARGRAFGEAGNYFTDMNLEDSAMSQDLIDYFGALAASLVKNIYVTEAEKKSARLLKDALFSSEESKVSSNPERRKFLYASAIKALREVYGVETGDTLAEISESGSRQLVGDIKDARFKLRLGLDALRSAAYFGCGQACQQLIEASEWDIVSYSNEEIRSLIRTQLFWYEKSLVDARLSDAQTLLSLLELPQAWAAMREDADLYQDVVRVVYPTGVSKQELLNANEEHSYIALSTEEVLSLVQGQIDSYRAFSTTSNPREALAHAPLTLLQQPNVVAAMKAFPSKSYDMLLEFFRLLTSHLTSAEHVATPEALAAFTEANPMLFKGYFEDRKAHDVIAKSGISAEESIFIQMRHDVLTAMQGVRHLVAKADIDELYAMRPQIAEKEKSNATADQEAVVRIKNRTDRLTNDDLLDQDRVMISFDRRGIDKMWSSPQATQSYREISRKLDEAKKKNDQKNVAEYQSRLSGATTQSDYQAYVVRKAGREQCIAKARDDEATLKNTREQELQALVAQEQALRDAFALRNPFSKTLELILLVVAQDFAVYKTLTNNPKRLIAELILEDIEAFKASTFAYRVAAEHRSCQRLPLVVAANATAYLTFLQVGVEVFLQRDEKTKQPNFNVAVEEFWTQLQDRLFGNQGNVAEVDIFNLLAKKPFYYLRTTHGGGKRLNEEVKSEITELLELYRRPNYQDSLSALMNGSMLLALFVSVHGHIFPGYKEEYTVVMRETDAARARLSKIVARPFTGTPSRLRNYLQMALVAMLDKPAIKRLLDKSSSNPWYSILLDKEVVKAGDYLCDMTTFANSDDIAVRAAIVQLSNTQETSITMTDTNNAYDLLAYLKAQLVKASAETEIDTLVIEFLYTMIQARYMEYCASTKTQVKPNTNPVVHTNEAAARRAARAAKVTKVVGNEYHRRESSSSSQASFTMPAGAPPLLWQAPQQKEAPSQDSYSPDTESEDEPKFENITPEVGSATPEKSTGMFARRGLERRSRARSMISTGSNSDDEESAAPVGVVAEPAVDAVSQQPATTARVGAGPALGFLAQIRTLRVDDNLSEEQADKAAHRISVAVRRSQDEKRNTQGGGFLATAMLGRRGSLGGNADEEQAYLPKPGEEAYHNAETNQWMSVEDYVGHVEFEDTAAIQGYELETYSPSASLKM